MVEGDSKYLINWLFCGLMCRSVTDWILESRFPIQLKKTKFVVCCVGSGLCEVSIILSEESYRARARVCVCVCVCLIIWSIFLNSNAAYTCFGLLRHKKVFITMKLFHDRHLKSWMQEISKIRKRPIEIWIHISFGDVRHYFTVILIATLTDSLIILCCTVCQFDCYPW